MVLVLLEIPLTAFHSGSFVKENLSLVGGCVFLNALFQTQPGCLAMWEAGLQYTEVIPT